MDKRSQRAKDRLTLICRLAFIVCLGAFMNCSNPFGPDEHGPQTSGGGPVSATDAIAPDVIIDAAFCFDSDTLYLEWTAPADEPVPLNTVAAYEIRYSYAFVDSSSFWDQAVIVDPATIPLPAEPGTPELFQFGQFERGRKIHAAIRSVDMNNNYSDISNIAEFDIPQIMTAIQGQCMDVLTYQPVPNLGVTIMASNEILYETMTDLDGIFSIQVPYSDAGGSTMTISTGASPTPYHRIIISDIVDDIDDQFWMVPFEEAECARFPGVWDATMCLVNIATDYFFDITDFRTWRSLPIDLYIPETEPYGACPNCEYDLRAWCVEAVTDLNNAVGLEVFRLVPSNPEVGIDVVWNTTSDGQGGNCCSPWIRDEDGYPIHGTVEMMCLRNCGEATVKRNIQHELCHALGYGDAYTSWIFNSCPWYLMRGHVCGCTGISTDEARGLNLLFSLPDDVRDLTIYECVGCP